MAIIKLKDLLFESLIHTPEFKKWFKNSKVIDKKGNPLIVYHATLEGGFHTFKQQEPNFLGTNSPLGHFGTKSQANFHASRFSSSETMDYLKKSPSIYAVYLSIQNPKIVTDDSMANPWWWMAEHAKKQGYDGLVYKNKVEGKGWSFVPFYPNQIKSAIYNNGEFDANNPNISK